MWNSPFLVRLHFQKRTSRKRVESKTSRQGCGCVLRHTWQNNFEVKTTKETIVSLRNELDRDLDTLSSKLDQEEQLFKRDCKKFGGEPASVDSFTELQKNIKRKISAYEEAIEQMNKIVTQERRPDDFNRAQIAAFLEDQKCRFAQLNKKLIKLQARLGEAQTRQSFNRDSGEMELWLMDRVTDLLYYLESYTCFTKATFEAELRTKAERVQAVLKLGNQLIQGRQCFGQEEAVKKRLQRIADLSALLTKFTQEQRQAQAAFNPSCIQLQRSMLEAARHWAFKLRSLREKDEVANLREMRQLVSHLLFGTGCCKKADLWFANKTTDLVDRQESTSRNSCAYASHLKQNAKNVEESTQHTKISLLDKETQRCATKNQINFHENFICNVMTLAHRRRQSTVQQLLAVEELSDVINRRLSAQEHDLPAPRAGDALNPYQLSHPRFTSQDARRQTFNAQPDHETLQRLQIGGHDMPSRQQTRGDVADARAAAGFFTQLGNGEARCFACNRLVLYSDAYNTRGMDLYALHEPDCTFMLSELGSFYVQVRLEADRNTHVHLSRSLRTNFLVANAIILLPLARIFRLDGIPITQLLPEHFSRVRGRQPYQRDMPSVLQLLAFMDDLYAQFGPILSTFREVLSQFSVLTVQYVVLIVTQAGHRETCGREVLEFARYMQYRMRQLGRSDMDSFVRDCLRDLESMNVKLDSGHLEQANSDYATENREVQNFFA